MTTGYSTAVAIAAAAARYGFDDFRVWAIEKGLYLSMDVQRSISSNALLKRSFVALLRRGYPLATIGRTTSFGQVHGANHFLKMRELARAGVLTEEHLPPSNQYPDLHAMAKRAPPFAVVL